MAAESVFSGRGRDLGRGLGRFAAGPLCLRDPIALLDDQYQPRIELLGRAQVVGMLLVSIMVLSWLATVLVLPGVVRLFDQRLPTAPKP